MGKDCYEAFVDEQRGTDHHAFQVAVKLPGTWLQGYRQLVTGHHLVTGLVRATGACGDASESCHVTCLCVISCAPRQHHCSDEWQRR